MMLANLQLGHPLLRCLFKSLPPLKPLSYGSSVRWRSTTSRNTTPEVENTRFSAKTLTVLGDVYNVDHVTNVTPRVVNKIGQCLHRRRHHPLYHVRKRVENFFSSSFVTRVGHPRFAILDDVSPVVTPRQNFDSLLVPENHSSRLLSDTYYINSEYMLRSHTTAHDAELIKSGLDSFLVIGDVYRRDEIDASHYPVFHQIDGACLFTQSQVFHDVKDKTGLVLFESGGKRTQDKQETHTIDATKLVEYSLKQTLVNLAKQLFGNNVEYRWVDCYFPFTHPSWELEILFNGSWMELLGCGVLEQQILNAAGAANKIGWAFGIGLDRLAMAQYAIPDIRLLWTDDARFLDQFAFDNPDTPAVFKPYSQFQPRSNDLSFWLPQNAQFSSNDFYDIVRSVGGDAIVKVTLNDVYTTNTTPPRTSHCYTIIYQRFDCAITQAHVNDIHSRIAQAATNLLSVEIR